MSAFGLNLAPDLGYPEQTGSQPNRMEWVRTTLSHNTVVVNEKEHNGNDYVETPHENKELLPILRERSSELRKMCLEWKKRHNFTIEI